MNIQWLFLGGPADGKTHWVKDGKYVRWAAEGAKEFEYRGHDFVYNGRVYRVGALDPNDLLPSKVADLIQSTGLQPLDEAGHQSSAG